MNQPTLISIDLETRGQDPAACAIASIGMAASGWNSEGWLDTYYAEISAASALQYGQEDADTMEWWAKQPQHTQAVLTRGRILIPDALAALAEKIAALNPKNEQGRHNSRVVSLPAARNLTSPSCAATSLPPASPARGLIGKSAATAA